MKSEDTAGAARDPSPATALASGLLVLCVYAATLSGNLGAAHDGIYYLNEIDAGVRLFHPHHLLYNAAARAWLVAARALGSEADSATIVAALNALAGALGIAIFHDLLRRRLDVGLALAFASSALCAFSFGFWFHSVCVEVYVIPLVILLAALHVLSGPTPALRRFALVGLLHGAAVLFHQVNVLFGTVVLFVAWQGRREVGWLRPLCCYAIAAAPLVSGGYLAAMLASGKVDSLDTAFAFLAGYAASGEFWQPLSLGTPLRVAVGASRALVGGHFAFALPPFAAAVAAAIPGHQLGDEAFLVRLLTPATAYLLLACALVWGVAMLAMGGADLRRLPWLAPRRRVLVGAIAVWLATYALFFSFWVPDNVEFWIVQSACLWLLVAAGAQARANADPGSARRIATVHALLAIGLVGLNFAGSIRFLREPENDYHLALVQPWKERARSGDLLVLGRSWILEEYAQRFVPARVLSLTRLMRSEPEPGALSSRVRAEIEATLSAGQRVLVSGEAVELDASTAREIGPQASGSLAELWRGYGGRLTREHGPAADFYLLEPAR